MKNVSPLILLIPLIVVVLLAAVGVVFSIWTYVLLGVVCPVVAGVIWLIYHDAEKKKRAAEEDLRKRS